MIDLSTSALRIANARKEKGFTQEELASRLGVSAQAISKWERALTLPDTDLLMDLSAILGASLSFLLGAEDSDSACKPKTVYDLATPNPLYGNHYGMVSVVFGLAIVPHITETLLEEIRTLRQNVFQETGVFIPSIRFKDGQDFAPSQVKITVFSHVVFDKVLSVDPDLIGVTVLDALTDAVYKNLYSYVNRHMVKLLFEKLREDLPFCVDGVIPDRITLSRLKLLLKSLVRDSFSIFDLLGILELIDEHLDNSPTNSELLTILKSHLKKF